MPPPASTAPAVIGWLARALVSAEIDLREAEQQVQAFLTSLFPDGWHGWAFARGDRGAVSIDVYEVTGSPAAVSALHRAGFTEIRLHAHKASKALTCVCKTHEVSL